MLLSTTTQSDYEKEPHNLFVDFSNDNLFEGPDRSFSKLSFELPYPIQEPVSLPSNAKDPLKDNLFYTSNYENAIFEARRRKLLHGVKDMDTLNDCTYKYIPKRLLEIYQENKKIEKERNRFYTNGVLDSVHMDNIHYLVWPKFNGTIEFLNVTNRSESFHIKVDSNTLFTSLRAYNISNQVFILLRSELKVILWKILDQTTFKMVYEKLMLSTLVDAKLNVLQKDHLGIITSDDELIIRNTDSNKILFKYKNQEKQNTMVQFEFWKGTKVVLVHKFTIQLFDYEFQKLLRTIDPKLMACNQLCSLKILDDSLILASNHYIIKTDLNQGKDFSTFAHTLSYPPLFMDLLTADQDSYLCLGNHLQDNKSLFFGKTMFGLPQYVPGVKETLNELLLRNSKFVLSNNLKSRLSYSIAGLKLIHYNDKVCLFYVNCFGEVFKQKISFKLTKNLKSLKCLTLWIEQLPIQKTLLHITHFAEMGQAMFFLKKSLNSANKKTDLGLENTKEEKFLEKYIHLYSKTNVKSTFGQRLLDIWEENGTSEDEEVVNDDEEIAFYDKVNNWMESNNQEI